MVCRHSHGHQITDHWLTIHWDKLFTCGCHRQNRGLRWIDDSTKVGGINHAQVRDREGPALQIGWSELVVASLGDERFGFAGNGAHRLGIGIADYRHHQPGWGVDGHAHMDVLIADEMIILEGTIDLGVVFEGKVHCLHDQIMYWYL